jgi:hypothetical protein
MSIPFPLQLCQHLLLVLFLLITGMSCNLSVVLICILFMARDGEHFFICLLVVWNYSVEKVLFSSVAHFFIGSLIFGGV